MTDVLREKGNILFKAGEYEAALQQYLSAIDIDDKISVLWSNCAMCDLKLEQYGSAVEHASKGIEIDPQNSKCYFRRGTALCGISQYKKAIPDFVKAVQLVPSNQMVQEKLLECRRMAKLIAFQEAIATQDQPSIFENLDLSAMPDEDELGPLEDPFKIDLDYVRKMTALFKEQKSISRKKVYQIVKATTELFTKEPTMNEIDPKDGEVVVFGDTHGQFFDVIAFFERIVGFPSTDRTFVFNGDFVDRGSWSTEVALTLYAMKLALPKNVYINRGNHETDSMNLTYGFSGECKAKYQSDNVFKAFSESFSCLPLACLIGNQYLVVHGGLFSKDGVTLQDIRNIDRFAQKQPAYEGLMMELLWADPQPEPGRSPSKRGIGLMFGPDVTKRFCDENGLKAVIRSHEMRDEGYTIEHDGRLVTVFSAPNYCDQGQNLGAIIKIGADMEMKPEQFSWATHPNVPPMAYSSGLMR